MHTQRLLRTKKFAHLFNTCTVRKLAQENVSRQPIAINPDNHLPPPLEKQPAREPFMKNLFLGKLDEQFLAFPEPQTNDRHKEFMAWIKPIEEYMLQFVETENVEKQEILTNLRDLGIFRACVDQAYAGHSCSETESSKLVEILSTLPWLGSYFVNNHILPVTVISKYGSQEQKDKYLPLIAKGVLLPTICVTEAKESYNISDLDTAISYNGKSWVLNGQKTFVANGTNANLFLVLTNVKGFSTTMTSQDMPTFVLVEREFGGITCGDALDLVGQKDTDMCIVNFNNVHVPEENFIDNTNISTEMLINILSPGTQDMAAQAIGILRNFIHLLTVNVLQRKHLNKNMHEFDAVKSTLGRLTNTLYNMESVLYFTTGMVDKFENQDVAVEKTITETYCANQCVNSIYQGLKLIGPKSYIRQYPYVRLFEDALALNTLHGYDMDANVYIALVGLQHAGKTMQADIRKLRNPFRFSTEVFKNTLFKRTQKWYLIDSMHPSLKQSADFLEDGISKFYESVKILFGVYGSTITEQQMELYRLSKMATEIYVCVSALSRASRSYCTGIRYSEHDLLLANVTSYYAQVKIAQLATEMKTLMTSDPAYKQISDSIYAAKGYYLEHPLVRNIH